MVSFYRAASLLFVAGMISQGLAFLVAFLLARLILPEALGSYGTFQALALAFVPLILLGFNYGIPLTKVKSGVADIFFLVLMSSLIYLIVFSFSGFFLSYLGVIGYSGETVVLLAIFSVFTAWHQFAHAVFVREKQFLYLSVFMIASALLIGSAKISAALLSGSGEGLLLSHTIAVSLLVACVMLLFFKKNWLTTEFPSFTRLRRVIKVNSQFTKFKVPVDLSSASVQALPLVLLTTFAGASVAGFYVLAKSLLIAPSRLISKALTDSILAEQIRLLNAKDPQAKVLFLKTSTILLVVSAFLFLPIILFGPTVFSFLFGESWHEAGIIAAIMCIWLACSFISKPALMLVGWFRLTKFDMYLEIGFSVVKIVLFYLALVIRDDHLLAITLFSALSGCRYLIILFWVRQSMNRLFKKGKL